MILHIQGETKLLLLFPLANFHPLNGLQEWHRDIHY